MTSCLRADSQAEVYQDYVTTMLYAIGNVVTVRAGGKWAFPRYHDLLTPRKTDTRTASEVKADILSKLTTGSDKKK